jgi:hypothetical protein
MRSTRRIANRGSSGKLRAAVRPDPRQPTVTARSPIDDWTMLTSPKPLLSVREVAVLHGEHPFSVYRSIQRGASPSRSIGSTVG